MVNKIINFHHQNWKLLTKNNGFGYILGIIEIIWILDGAPKMEDFLKKMLIDFVQFIVNVKSGHIITTQSPNSYVNFTHKSYTIQYNLNH